MANRYTEQRAKVVPPYVPLKVLRKVSGLSLDQVCERVSEYTGNTLSRGALSAIENGHRGASAEVLAGIAHAYDIELTDVDTKYTPRNRVAA